MIHVSHLKGVWQLRLVNPFYFMPCRQCKSENVLLLKEGNYHTGTFCKDCGWGEVDWYSGSCCGNPDHRSIKFEQANGVVVQRVACKNCRSLIGGAKKKDKDFNTYSLYSQKAFLEDEQKKAASRLKLSDYIKQISQEHRDNERQERWQQYSEYLTTPKWKAKRLQVLERENYLCQGCQYAKAVHVHHTTYNNLYDELLFQLVALCVDCHSRLHPEKQLL